MKQGLTALVVGLLFGLGLAISRSLIELHGGTMKITSKEGKGTTVAVNLPKTRAQNEPADLEGAAA